MYGFPVFSVRGSGGTTQLAAERDSRAKLTGTGIEDRPKRKFNRPKRKYFSFLLPDPVLLKST